MNMASTYLSRAKSEGGGQHTFMGSLENCKLHFCTFLGLSP